MALPLAPAHSVSSLRFASWGGWSSLLRPAASDHRAASGRQALWRSLSRAMRAAGPDSRSRPLHGLMGNVDCVRGSESGQRLRGG
jgi:hypothetical protein